LNGQEELKQRVPTRVNHNFSWQPIRHQRFIERLDRAMSLGTNWLLRHKEQENPALLYMLADMAALSGDRRLNEVVASALEDPLVGDSVWRPLLDPTAKVRRTTRQELDGLQDYQRWLLYAMSPPDVELGADDRRAMFARDRFAWGSRTHQLFVLLLYSSRVGPSAELTDLINHLSEAISREAHWDFRVTDLYLQRIALIVAAGRPDLLRRRWIERAIANQTDDGGWASSWYGLGPGLFEINLQPPSSNSHTTVQAVWLLYMLKYRYPDWIERYYRSPGR
jgi:hypothetical protein